MAIAKPFMLEIHQSSLRKEGNKDYQNPLKPVSTPLHLSYLNELHQPELL